MTSKTTYWAMIALLVASMAAMLLTEHWKVGAGLLVAAACLIPIWLNQQADEIRDRRLWTR
jgi:hypothetical protein